VHARKYALESQTHTNKEIRDKTNIGEKHVGVINK
jgi:hypothetical protein